MMMDKFSTQGINPNFQVEFGWDQPLGTFFLNVEDTSKDDDEDRIVHSIGGILQEITDVDELLAAVSEFTLLVNVEGIRGHLLTHQKTAPFSLSAFVKKPAAKMILDHWERSLGHSLDPLDQNHRVVMGWHRFLGTFFLSVTDKRVEEGDAWYIIEERGTSMSEFCNAESLRALLEKASELASFDEDEIRQMLLADQEAKPFDADDFVAWMEVH